TGLLIDARGNLATFSNSGTLTAESHGPTQNAYGVQDNSGTLTSVTNAGSVYATVKGTGAALAFDLSHATSAVTFNNSGSIIGDIVLGSGNNTLTSTNGGISGAIKAGAGNDTVIIGNTVMTGSIALGAGSNSVALNNSTLTGGIGADGGTVALNMSGSTLNIPATGTVHVTNGNITGASTVNFAINAAAGLVGGIKADGTLAVAGGTTLNTPLVGPVSSSLTVNLIEAQVLSMGANIAVQQPASTLMYTQRIALAADNANILQYQVTRNTASQLGLSSDLGKVYEASISALATDDELSTLLGGMTDRTKFTHALGQLLPDTTDAMRTASLQGQNLAQSAIRRRLDGLLRDRDEPLGRYRTSYWAQTFGTYGTQSAQGNAPGYRVITGGLAAGVDGELSPNALGGISLNQTESYLKEKDADRSGHLSTTAFDIYTRINADPGYIQAVVGYGYNSHSSSRNIAIDTIARTAESDWTGNQLSTALDVGTSFAAGNTRITPYLRGAYARIFEQAHKETGAGDGVDLTYGHQVSTSLRAGGGFLAQYQIQLSDLSIIELEGRGDYAHEFKTDPALINARFSAGTTSFTMQGPAGASAIISGGAGASWKQKFSSWSLDYDAEKAGGYLGHTVTLTYRARF
ncbi:MAG: autotransporter outer membrane beta-barrel domain-containing protein, partial [Rhodospirillaceae bacterium]